ncbi:outer membrane beta-barrel protein [Segetibacter aerophilus]|nr:outer membrane beta-barrel protein [Segetibacter aerophilus]
MRKVGLLIFSLIIFTTIALAQKGGTVQGVAFDTLLKQPVSGATVTLLRQKDSSLVSFSLADEKGRFDISDIASGDYRLMITHVNYRNSNKLFTVNSSNMRVDLGNVVMHNRSTMLEEVVVTFEAPPVTLNGDTIQYNAGSFKTQPNATVEELIKKLPGLQVDKNGNIKAQGEKVKKVLVDGKEFFGNDPKLATRNLPADAVDKVDVYDRQSDQAQLTGFDDGSGEKTINLKLKKERKGGMFGKINAGAGTSDRYQGKFNVNSFKGARQTSLIGMGNNTNAEGFSFVDMLNFSGGLQQQQNGGGGSQVLNQMAGTQNNNGINTTWGGGFNHNDIIGTKTDFRSNYFYSRYNPFIESNVQREYLLPDSSYFYKSNSRTNNLTNTHRVNFITDIQIDSFHSLKISPSFGSQRTTNNSVSDYETSSGRGQVSNSGFSNNLGKSSGYNFQNEVLFRKKFRLKGRTFSINLQATKNKSDGNEDQQAITQFYNKESTLVRRDSIYRQSQLDANSWSYTAKAIYTEPVFKRSLLEFSIANSNSKNNSNRTTYDYNSSTGKYNRLNPMLSNNFDNSYGYINSGLRLRTQRKKYYYAVGAYWQNAALQGKIKTGINDSLIKKAFSNLLPVAQFQYNFNRFNKLSFFYHTYTTQPSVTQLQPVPDVSNPLYIREGNPFLKQEYTHAVRLGYTSINFYKNRNAFININASQTQNKIVNYDIVDSVGLVRSRPVNVNGVYDISGSLSYSFPIKPLRGSMEVSSTIAFNKGKQFINSNQNNIATTSIGPAVRLDVNPTEKLNLVLSASANYNSAVYSLQKTLNATYLSQNYGAEIGWQLPAKFFFATDFTYNMYSRQASAFNTNVPLWTASLSKLFLKNNRGEIKLSGYDLLNRNISINRNTTQNYIEDASITSLRRYFLLSFTFSLNKTGLSTGGGRNNVQIRM